MQQKKIPKTPLKRVDEKRVYPLFKALLNAGIDSKGNISLRWITFIPSTEAYVKKYFEDNAAPQPRPFINGKPPSRLQMVFVPCTYTVGDKEFIA